MQGPLPIFALRFWGTALVSGTAAAQNLFCTGRRDEVPLLWGCVYPTRC